MNEIQKKLKEMSIKSIIIGIIELLILFLFFKENSFWVFLGVLGSIVSFFMMTEDIIRMTEKTKFSLYGYFFRMIVYFLVLAIPLYFSKIAFLCSTIGLFNLKIVPFISKK